MPTTVTIVDTGSGNLRSVARAFEACGGSAVISGDPAVLRAADKLVVPGQGAFGAFIEAVRESGIEDALRDFLATERPYFGICLGLQILFEDSEEQRDESGPVRGLGMLDGHVVRFCAPLDPLAGPARLKVPHIGWNRVRHSEPQHPLLLGIPDDTAFYFVHSYYVSPADPSVVALWCDYGQPFAAAVAKDNVFAVQFHPEKSQGAGLRLIETFVHSS